jgi:hypothetical protein
MDPSPCETCITLVMCKARIEQDMTKFLLRVRTFCPAYAKYVIEKDNGKDIVLDFDHVCEAGRFLGYEITDNRRIKNVHDVKDDEIQETK